MSPRVLPGGCILSTGDVLQAVLCAERLCATTTVGLQRRYLLLRTLGERALKSVLLSAKVSKTLHSLPSYTRDYELSFYDFLACRVIHLALYRRLSRPRL